jgi:hypothetical protein
MSVGTKSGLHSGCAEVSHLNCSSDGHVQVACADMHCPAFFEELTSFPHIPFIHFTFTMHFNNKLVKQLLKTVSLTTIHRGIFNICVHLLTTMIVKKVMTSYCAIHMFPLTC